MAADKKTLARIHRVRTVQLNLTRAAEAQARDQAASEALLSARIAQLADTVAPAATRAHGFSLGATAHYRERLHQSAAAAAQRVSRADTAAERAAEATREAWRDQSAVEKLMARADLEAALKELKAMQDAPPVRKRHDPC